MSDTEAPAAAARRLIRSQNTATLATNLAAGDGWPYASLVLTACDHDGSPLLLISGLAEHTKNITADPRVSLLFDGTAGLADRLTGARATVLGRAERSQEPHHRERFLARHPSAAMYAGFGDFAFYRVSIARTHLVAGFGRIHW
ncbi:MAG TPA: pyridoxamine 5'-phosphate oxidase family protein, partial [Candidatus Sulfotelmatobacter sp.]|nr:pyridoxamine 5'-phosphate oxidase family protein [Candidatus Sulfotelmatobacter sp.]